MRKMFSEKQIKELTKEFIESGNLHLQGNLIVDGYIEPKEFELDEDITISSLPSGVQCYYAHARISNGKLSIVIALNCTGAVNVGALPNTKIGSLALSDDILSKLYPYVSSVLANQYGYLTSPSWQSTGMTKINILKDTNAINFYLSQVADSDVGGSGDVRFEFNFLLS